MNKTTTNGNNTEPALYIDLPDTTPDPTPEPPTNPTTIQASTPIEETEELVEELSAYDQAMISEEKQQEGTFLTGGNTRDFVELGEEKTQLDEDTILNPRPKRDGQILLDYLRSHLHKFDSPYAYIGGEANSPDRSRYGSAEIKILIARLSTYESTSLSMSHSLIAQVIQEEDYTWVDVAFLPKPNDYDLLKENDFPVWFGTNSKLGPDKFDVLAISHPVSMEQINFVPLLHDSGIPLFKQQRLDRPEIPIVVVGGANSGTTAPLAGPFMTKDGRELSCFMDAVIYGDGEEAFKEFIRIVREGKTKGWSKREILRACHGTVQGFYEPDLYEHHYDGHGVLEYIRPKVDYAEFPVRRATVKDLNTVKSLESKIMPFTGDGASVDYAIAGNVGCIGSAGFGACSFCREGSEGPYRERTLESVLKGLEVATRRQGNKEVSFFSLNFNMYTHLFPLMLESVKRGYKVGLISQRVDMLAETPEQVRVQRWLHKSNYTLGVEGISQRMRNYLNKNLTEEEILKVVRVMMEEGAGELKLFYIASGKEEAQDIDEFCAFVDKVDHMRREGGFTTRCRASFTPLFPSAQTPLQFAPAMAAIQHGSRSLDRVFNKLREANWGRRLSVSGEEPLVSNTINHGGRNIVQILLKAHFLDGFRFYGNVPKGMWARWKKRIDADPNINLEQMWGEKTLAYVFPWDDINYGSNKRAVWDGYLTFKSFVNIPYCLTTPTKRGECHYGECGCCSTDGKVLDKKTGQPLKEIRHGQPVDTIKDKKAVFNIIQSIVNRDIAPPIPMNEIIAAAKSREKAYHLRVLFETTDPIYRFVLKGYFGNVIARSLMLTSDTFNEAFISTLGHARIAAGANTMRDWTFGRNIYDFSLSNHIQESELRKMVLPANEVLREGKIIDIRMDSHLTNLRSDVDYAIYTMLVPNKAVAFDRLRSDIENYFKRKSAGKDAKIKIKVTHGKGMFKTEERTLDGTDVRQMEYQWMGDHRGTLVRFVISANYNPMSMLEAVTKRKAFTWKPFPIFCNGYVQLAQETGETDIFAALKGETTTCTQCCGPLELDLFTGEKHRSGVCMSCTLDHYPVDMNWFYTKEMKAVEIQMPPITPTQSVLMTA